MRKIFNKKIGVLIFSLVCAGLANAAPVRSENEDFEIVGYTDETENNKKKLSLLRAEKMAEFLKQNGLRKDIKISKITGKSSENLVDTNDTEIGRYNNRRVEIFLKNGKVKKIDVEDVGELLSQLKDE